ncbi:MAG: hypothetical protein MJ245_02560 [Clostridia bacterium]|nr:hypothetical protein [Clostridia bacterium]
MPILLTTVIGCIIVGAVVSGYVQTKDKKKVDKFLTDESKITIKTHDALNDIEFIHVDFDDVKFKAKSKNAKENVKALQDFSKLKLANFNGLSNQDLKNKYGNNNFDEVLSYQENYDNLFDQIRTTASSLIDDEDESSAMNILRFAVDMGDDVTVTYTNLAELYIKNNMRKELYSLVDTVKQNKNLSQQKIMSYIKNLEKENVKSKSKKN